MKKGILFSLIWMVFCISCTKDKNTVKGQITTTVLGGGLIAQVVPGATVYLLGADYEKMYTTTADSEGNYIFSDVKDGAYKVSAEAKLNGFTYTVESGGIFHMKGKQTKTFNLLII